MAVSKSKRGLKTQKLILQTAKEFFYEKGYEKTTIKEICEKIDIRTGNLAYYYKTKDDLVKAIYDDLFLESYTFVSTHLEHKTSELERYTINSLVDFRARLRDKNTTRFYLDNLKKKQLSLYLDNNLIRFVKQFITELKLDISEKELQDILYAEYGLRRELTIRMIENPEENDFWDYFTTINIFRCRLYKIDENLMRAFLFNAMEFERKNDFSQIRLLI